jgi:hypothetical protein
METPRSMSDFSKELDIIPALPGTSEGKPKPA